jgi:hypothetical protein
MGRYTYAEHLALNSFVIAQSTLVGLIGLVSFNWAIYFNPIIYAMIVWMIYQIFETKRKRFEVLFSSLIVTLLFFIQFVLIIILGGATISFLRMYTG